MKKLLVLIIAIVSLISCTSVKNGSEKVSAEQKALQIHDSVEARTLKVTFNYVTPMRMPPHYLTTSYSIRLKGDTIDSYLPYFGRAYTSNPATNDRSPLSFKGTVQDLTTSKGRKGEYKLGITTRNDNEQIKFLLTIYPNGQAYLNVSSYNRETIDFNGEMDL